MREFQDSLLAATYVRDVTRVKGWLADGAVCLDGWSAEHTIQPPDEIEQLTVSEHLLAFTFSRGDRQVSRFAGQEYDGIGYENHFFLLPAGVPAEFAWTSTDEAMVLGIAPAALCNTAAQIGYAEPDRVQLQPTVFARDEQIARFIGCLLHEIRTGGAGGRLYSESVLTALNVHLLRHYSTVGAKSKPHKGGLATDKLQQVLDYIDANLADSDISLAMLSQLVGLSGCYFSRRFKQATGLAPHQYVIRRRVERAKGLLRQCQLSIAQVALECGFSSQSHFHGTFRKLAGTTPGCYREEMRL